MSKKVVIIGAGGHTRSLITLLKFNQYSIDNIVDENFDKAETINGIKLIGDYSKIRNNDTIVLSIGECNKRMLLYKEFYNQVLKETLVHPSAIIENYTTIGFSNQVFANTLINSNTIIGENNIINSGAIIEHETIIESNNHISIGAIIGGRSKIGSNCFIGAGAVIIDKIYICDNVIIGANSLIIKDINTPGTYVGNPAKKIK